MILVGKVTGGIFGNQRVPRNDADTLEIMRLTQRVRFKPSHLHFGQNVPKLYELRETLIDEAWQFIESAEQAKGQLSPIPIFKIQWLWLKPIPCWHRDWIRNVRSFDLPLLK
jgi:hypothetical protein